MRAADFAAVSAPAFFSFVSQPLEIRGCPPHTISHSLLRRNVRNSSTLQCVSSNWFCRTCPDPRIFQSSLRSSSTILCSVPSSRSILQNTEYLLHTVEPAHLLFNQDRHVTLIFHQYSLRLLSSRLDLAYSYSPLSLLSIIIAACESTNLDWHNDTISSSLIARNPSIPYLHENLILVSAF